MHDHLIYCIQNENTGMCYIGRTSRYTQRKSQHLQLLRKGTHHSPKLQHSYNKHGEAAFTFEILLSGLSKTTAMAAEQYYMETYGAVGEFGYNLSSSVSGGTEPSVFYTAFEKTKSLQDWANEYNLPYSTLRNRVERAGQTLEEALKKPFNKLSTSVKYEGFGLSLTVPDWSNFLGLSKTTLRRLLINSTIEEVCYTKITHIALRETVNGRINRIKASVEESR